MNFHKKDYKVINWALRSEFLEQAQRFSDTNLVTEKNLEKLDNGEFELMLLGLGNLLHTYDLYKDTKENKPGVKHKDRVDELFEKCERLCNNRQSYSWDELVKKAKQKYWEEDL